MITPRPGPPGDPAGHHRTALTVEPFDLPEHAESLLGKGYRVALVAGHDDGGQLRAVYLFTATAPDRRVEVHVPLRQAAPWVPSLAGMSFAAGRFEREMHDLFGIVATGHPLPRRLVRHAHWPRGWYPMRADAGEPPAFRDVAGPIAFSPVDGAGVYEIPVGPVHSGINEPGHFRLSAAGENIVKMKARLWFVHKGIERLFHGRDAEQGIELAERISGDTAVGHTLAFCHAVEDAYGHQVAPDSQRLRAILLELERLYNHVADLGALCNDVGYGILHNHAQRVREELLRLNDSVTGHRLLRGAIHPGGVTVAALPDPDRLSAIGADVAEIVDLALANNVVADRFTGTAVLTRDQAKDLGALGYVARASGLGVDARHDHPFLPGQFPRVVHTRTEGDVLSRFLVRAEEIANSIWLITALGSAEFAPSAAPRLAGLPGRAGVGIVEGWRGTIVHRVEFAPDGLLRRVKVVDPSFFNWPGLAVSLADTVVPDFPLANKSFNLSHAGNDL